MELAKQRSLSKPQGAEKIVENESYDDQEDELRAYQLRFKFEEHQFTGLIWTCLRECGWTFSGSSGRRYQSPPIVVDEIVRRIDFEDANDVAKFLDQFAFADVTSNLQSVKTSDAPSAKCSIQVGNNWEVCDDSKSEEIVRREGLKFRNDVLRLMFERSSIARAKAKKAMAEDRCRWKADREDPESSQAQASSESSERDQDRRRSNRLVSLADVDLNQQPMEASATATEKGTNLYLQKHKKRLKSSKSTGKRGLNDTATIMTGGASSVDPSILDNLVFPSIEECQEILTDRYSLKQILKCEEAYQKEFHEWRFLLSTNHSLLFYGAGSKFDLLESFCERELEEEGYVLSIHGFDKEASVEGILDLLVEAFLDGVEPEPSSRVPQTDGTPGRVGSSNPWRAHETIERAICVSRALAWKATETLVPIFLVIHNIEGEGLRDSVSQDALAALVVNSTVENGVASLRLVASVDHVDAPAQLWSSSSAANFSWIWKEVHTHRPFMKELVMLPDQELRKKERKRKSIEREMLERVIGVLESLAPRHAEVLQILARLQLDLESQSKSGAATDYMWIDYVKLREQCKARCVVNKDGQLRDFISELYDHGLIETKAKNGSSFDELRIPHGKKKLREILEYNRDSTNSA